jgi:hypothetical protein
VTDYKPQEETHYRAHFHINPNSLTMGSSDAMYILYALDRAGTVVERVELGKNASGYFIRAGAVEHNERLYNHQRGAHGGDELGGGGEQRDAQWDIHTAPLRVRQGV